MKKKIVDNLTEEQKEILKKASPAVNRQVGSDFTPIATTDRRQILFRAAPFARQPSQLWTKDRKLKKKFFVRRFLEYQDQFECEFADRASRVLGEVDKELDLAGSNDIFFNIRCEESTLFFHLPRRAVSSREGMLLVRVPKMVYEVQRRAQLRYRVNAEDRFVLQSDALAAWIDQVEILDVSSGGFAIQIRFESADAAAGFMLVGGTRIPFRLDLEVFSFVAEGEVRYLKRSDPSAADPLVVRLGIRFVGLPQDTVEAIQILVLERSYVRLREMFGD